MPTYEYECQKCKKRFDMVQSMKDSALKTCPRDLCRKRLWGRGRVRRLLSSGAGLIFKGTGFYTTDYRSENYKQSVKKETESAASDKKAGEAAPAKGAAAPKETAAKKTTKTKEA